MMGLWLLVHTEHSFGSLHLSTPLPVTRLYTISGWLSVLAAIELKREENKFDANKLLNEFNNTEVFWDFVMCFITASRSRYSSSYEIRSSFRLYCTYETLQIGR